MLFYECVGGLGNREYNANFASTSDIFVINQGLHFSGYEPIVNALNGTYKDTILSAMRRGSKILWR